MRGASGGCVTSKTISAGGVGEALACVHDVLAQRVRQPVEEAAPLLAAVSSASRLRLRDQVVAARLDVVPRRAVEVEGQRVVVEARAVVEHEAGQRPEALADAVELGLGVVELQPQALVHVLVEVLEQHPARVVQARADLLVHLRLQLPERGVDLLGRAALLVDGEDALLEVHARLDGAQHFVGGAEDAAEEAELLARAARARGGRPRCAR